VRSGDGDAITAAVVPLVGFRDVVVGIHRAGAACARVAWRPGVLFEAGLGLIERRHINDSVVLSREDFLTDLDPAAIYNVAEQIVDVASSKGTATIQLAVLG